MKARFIVPIVLLVALSGCGDSSAPASLSVTCNGSLALSGTTTVDVSSNLTTKATTLTFADPVNAGRTGTIAVDPGQKCTIGMTVAK